MQKVLGQGVGFKSFDSLKRAMPGQSGFQLHHIVEQTPANLSKFGSQAIHNTANVVPVEASIHIGKGSISAYYSSKDVFTEGKTVREWLRTQSFDQQYEFGIKVLKEFEVIQ